MVLPGELSSDEICDYFAQLKSGGTRSVTLTGGEPLLRSDLPSVIRVSKEFSFRTYLATNGLLLEDFAERIANAGVDRVSISIDGMFSTHNKLRGIPSAFESAIAGIRKLKSIDGDLDVRIVTTISKDNISEVRRIIDLCNELG